MISRRGEERVTINKEFETFDAFFHEYVTNISRSGIFVRSKNPLPVGTEINPLSFPIGWFVIHVQGDQRLLGAGNLIFCS